ncbi:hypothetical protein AUP68_04035 [Ilyonectria robusta]
MADPLSVASGVAGLVSLGISTCNGLHRYLDAVKGRQEDITKVAQRVRLLESTIEALQDCERRLGGRYERAATTVAVCLQLCGNELRALETTIKALEPPSTPSNSIMNKLDRGKLALTCPFHRQNLLQVEDQLSRVTGILNTAVQALTLNVNIGVVSDVEKSTAAIWDAFVTMQESLAKVKCQLESASSTVERTDQKTVTISAQIEGLLGSKQDTSTPREILHELVMKSTEQSVQLSSIGQLLAYKPEYLNLGQRPIASPDFTTAPLGAPNSHGYSRNAQPPQSNMGSSDFHDLWISACTCREFHRGRSYQKSNFYRQSWGPFAFLVRKEICGQHHPGCVLHSPNQLTSSTNLNLSFTGLRSTLSRVVGVSLTPNWKTTEWTIAPALQAYRTVDSRFSPAFQLLADDTEIRDQLILTYPRDSGRLVELLHKLKHRLHMIYMSRSASPLDVDEKGRTFLHRLMSLLSPHLSSHDEGFVAVFRALFHYHRDIGASFDATDMNQRTIFDIGMFPTAGSFARAYDVLDEAGVVAPITKVYNGFSYCWFEPSFVLLFNNRQDIAESLQFYGTLSMAIFYQSENRVRALLESELLPQCLSERGESDQTVLHCCSNWAAGLRLLFAHKQTHELLNTTEISNSPPVLYALESSGRACNADDKWEMCHDCDCYVPLEIFLAMDCSLYLFDDLALRVCSLRARIMFLEHLRNRRERLKHIAGLALSPRHLATFGVAQGRFPEASAAALLQTLRQQGVNIPQALELGPFEIISKHSLYHIIHCSKVAELAFNMGFRDVDTLDDRGFTPLMVVHVPFPNLDAYEQVFQYYNRLLEKGAKLDAFSNQLHISAAHHVASSIGRFARFGRHGLFGFLSKPVLDSLSPESKRLCSVVCNLEVFAHIPCACGSRDGCLPLSILLTEAHSTMEMFNIHGSDRFEHSLWLVQWLSDTIRGFDTSMPTRLIIFRSMTMDELGIRHLCSDWKFYGYEYEVWRELQEEWEQILDEDSSLIEELEELVDEFEQEYARLNVPLVQFLRGYWRMRMEEVREARLGDLHEDQKRALREIGVVMEI